MERPKTTKNVGQPCVICGQSADAQAAIAALQARVQELEQWVQDQSTANLETMRHTDEMQSRALEAEQQLTRRTAELERVRDQYADLRKMVLALPKVEAVPMTDAGWTRERPTAAGWYWNRINGTVGIALITRRDGRLYVWLKFKDAWLTREGWLDYIHGEWLGPITPDSYARGLLSGTWVTTSLGIWLLPQWQCFVQRPT